MDLAFSMEWKFFRFPFSHMLDARSSHNILINIECTLHNVRWAHTYSIHTHTHIHRMCARTVDALCPLYGSDGTCDMLHWATTKEYRAAKRRLQTTNNINFGKIDEFFFCVVVISFQLQLNAIRSIRSASMQVSIFMRFVLFAFVLHLH